jgi:hypothetical protein
VSRLIRVVTAAVLGAGALGGAPAHAADDADAARPNKPSTKIFPLPMYATTPNEGNTYGVMPVFVRVGSEGKITSITAPSASWNRSAGVTGTFRFYRYLDPQRSYNLLASASTTINRTLSFEYEDKGREPGKFAGNLMLKVRRNLFYRYFGLGPDTTKAGESSYTRLAATANGRWARNFTRNLSLGMLGELRADRAERHAISGLPLLHDRYPDAVGLSGAALARQGLGLRYDTRDGAVYAERGLLAEVTAAMAEGIQGFDLFAELDADVRALVPEASFLQLAGRAAWKQLATLGRPVPFYYRASLGGELSMRGFPEDRFIGNGAWEVDLEQRIRLFQTHLFGVVADWRVDPFIGAGQVYTGADPFSHVRVAGGLGFRVWVRPDVLGRVDVAYGGEGVEAYVVVGYPY